MVPQIICCIKNMSVDLSEDGFGLVATRKQGDATNTTIDTEISSISEISELRRKDADNEKKIRDLQQQILVSGWQGKPEDKSVNQSVIRIWGKRPMIDGQDRSNYGLIIPRIKKYFMMEKWLPKNWNVYSTVGNCFCVRIMKDITVPFGYSREGYYEKRVTSVVLVKWKNMKTNFVTEVRKWVDKSLREGRQDYELVKKCLLDKDKNCLLDIVSAGSIDYEGGVRAIYLLLCMVSAKFYRIVS